MGGWIGGQLGFDTKAWRLGFAVAGSILLLALYHLAASRTPPPLGDAPASNDDYKRAVFDDLSRGPNP